jgi:hypothetical protein
MVKEHQWWRLFVITVFLFLIHGLAFAQVDDRLRQRLSLDFEIQTCLIQSDTRIQRLIDHHILPFRESDTIGVEDRLATSNKNATFPPLDTLGYLKGLVTEDAVKAIIDSIIDIGYGEEPPFNEWLALFKQTTLYDSFILHQPSLMKKLVLEFRELSRIHGVSVAVVWFATEFAQISAITALTAYGYGHYALLAPFFPLSFFNTGLAINLQHIRHHKHMRKGYGSAEIKRKAGKLNVKNKRHLRLNYHYSILMKVGEQGGDSLKLLSLHEPSFLSVIFRGGRYQPRRVYHRKVKRFYHQHHIGLPFTEGSRSSKFHKRMQTVFWVHYLKETDSVQFQQLLQDVSAATVVVSKEVYETTLQQIEVKRWIHELLELSSFDQFAEHLSLFPDHLKVGTFIDLMEQVVLPAWSRQFKRGGFRTFRKVVKGVRRFKYDTLLQQHHYWNEGYRLALLKQTALIKGD